MEVLCESKLSPGSFIGSLTKVKEVIPRAHWPSNVSTNAIKRWPREPAATIGVVARAAGAGAVLIGFAIGANGVYDGSLTLATVSASRGPAVTDKCTDNPGDPTCPPAGPGDVKCASAAWRYTAACVGGPFDPNNTFNCAPVFVGCPGYVPNTPPPTPPSIEPPSHDKGHEPPPPPPHHHEPGSPPGTGHPGPGEPPPPVGDHPEPGTPGGPPHPQEAAPPPAAPPPVVGAPPVAPVGPPPAIEGPHAPDVPAPAIQAPVAPAPVMQAPVAPAPVMQAPAPVMQAPVMAPAPVAPPVMAPAPAPSPPTSK
jgi:hypothetical protein